MTRLSRVMKEKRRESQRCVSWVRAHTSSILSGCIIIIIMVTGVLVVAGVGAAHCLGPPHKLGVVAEFEVELRGGAEAGQEHVLQVYK